MKHAIIVYGLMNLLCFAYVDTGSIWRAQLIIGTAVVCVYAENTAGRRFDMEKLIRFVLTLFFYSVYALFTENILSSWSCL